MPNQFQKGFLIALFFGFAVFQLGITTLSKSHDWYPFSPYKMFSKNWQSGIVMERIRFSNTGDVRNTWELLGIPFFQANHLSFSIFLDHKNPEISQKLCSLLGEGHYSVLSEQVKFERISNGMQQRLLNSEKVYECL